MTSAVDEEIIRKRLLLDGEGAGDDRKLTMILKSFLKVIFHHRPRNLNGIRYEDGPRTRTALPCPRSVNPKWIVISNSRMALISRSSIYLFVYKSNSK